MAKTISNLGKRIGKIPVIEKGLVDEFLIAVGTSLDESGKKELEKTMRFFIRYKESGIAPIAEQIDTIHILSNKPTIMLYNKNILCFKEIQEAI